MCSLTSSTLCGPKNITGFKYASLLLLTIKDFVFSCVNALQHEREYEARMNALQRERENEGEGEARDKGETERHSTATEVDQRRGAQLYSSENENAYSLPTRREVALRAREEAEQARRRAQRDDEELKDWAASTLMRTPSSAPPRTLFAQRPLSPIQSEEEITYDSAAERDLERLSDQSLYEDDTELAEYTARSAQRRAAKQGEGGAYALPEAVDAEEYPGGEFPPAGWQEREEESLDALPTSMEAEELSAGQGERRAELYSPTRRQPDHAHQKGSDSGSDKSVNLDAKDLVQSFHNSAMEMAAVALQKPFVSVSSVACEYLQSRQSFPAEFADCRVCRGSRRTGHRDHAA